MSIQKDIVLRARIVYLFIILFAIAIVIKILHIQIGQREKWEEISKNKFFKRDTIKATRGNIYSDDGSLLATSLPFYRVTMDPTVITDSSNYWKDLDSLALMLAKTFHRTTSRDQLMAVKKKYKQKLANARHNEVRYLVLTDDTINHQQKKEMETWPIIRDGRYKSGVYFEKINKRYRPFKDLALRTIGYKRDQDLRGRERENEGKGIEMSFDGFLAGRDGSGIFQHISGRLWKPIHDDSEVPPEQGVDVHTTLDINIQDVAESSLQRHLKKHRANFGCVILMEVATGQIKAMANLGLQKDSTYAEDYNYAIAMRTEPGSTFKLASLMALFEDSELSNGDSVFCEWGKYRFHNRDMTDANPKGYGKLSVQEVFEKSSNIGVSKLVHKHFASKEAKLMEYYKQFGLKDPLNFQIKGEANPEFTELNSPLWSGTSLPWMSIGYTMRLTPLHTLTFYNAVANNGNMMQPYIVSEVRSGNRVLERYEPKVIRKNICSEKTLKMAREMCEGVVQHGTAKNINNALYKIAGKTGTAQKLKDGRYTKDYYTSFVGYFPAQQPKYSCIVVIDNPRGYQQYGADVAAPVFREIADKIYSTDLTIHPSIELAQQSSPKDFPLVKSGNYKDLNYLCNQFGIANHLPEHLESPEWVATTRQNEAILWTNRSSKEHLVPDVTGMSLKDALYVLENAGMKVSFSGHGRVKSQSLPPGSRLKNGAYIYIVLD